MLQLFRPKFLQPTYRHMRWCKSAISNVNFLPEIGLYNRAIGDFIEIVYSDQPVGLNDKQHYHLPNYVVVDYPNLRLPTNIAPWDELHKTVSTT